jgi:hypothetical protein
MKLLFISLMASLPPGHRWQHVDLGPISGEFLVRESDQHTIAGCMFQGKWNGVLFDMDPKYSLEYETLEKCKEGVEKIVEKAK